MIFYLIKLDSANVRLYSLIRHQRLAAELLAGASWEAGPEC